MNDALVNELRLICQEMNIENETSFRYRDTTYSVSRQEGSQLTPKDALVHEIGEVLYAKVCTRQDLIQDRYPASVQAYTDSEFIKQLHQANHSRQSYEKSWRIYHIGADGRVSVHKGNRSRVAFPGEYVRNKFTGDPPKLGDIVDLLVYPSSLELSPGFYFAFGQRLSDQFDEYALVRIYFHVEAEGAIQLLRVLSQSLNQYRVPYRFKCLNSPSEFKRADAAVLYVSKRYFTIVSQVLEDIYPELEGYLRVEIPMFCYPFKLGIGIADDSGTNESFGKQRCRLLARSLVEMWEKEIDDLDQRFEFLQKQFLDSGVSIHLPFMKKGASDIWFKDQLERGSSHV